jgi:CubicO group peptidase (beta-lactamase class C family)
VSEVVVEGTVDPRFAAVRDVMAQQLADGLDVGASVCATIGGEVVVDLWGGHADEARTIPWQRDTVVNVWSTTKTMLALTALLLVDRGELDLDAPVARYWPEFAAGGKEAIEVRHLLSHTAGLSGWDEPVTTDVIYDWDRTCALLAAQEPWWEPGTASGYHALTEGFLVGEVIRRASGMTMGELFRTEVAEPLGIDFHVGTPEEVDPRVVPVIAPPPAEAMGDVAPDSIAARTLLNPALDPMVSATVPWRRAEIPAANGHGNARSVALAQSIVSGEGTAPGGKQLLAPATVGRIFEEQSYGTDLVLSVPLRIGIGYGLNSPDTPLSANERACFWGGWGGSLVVNDVDAGTTFAYVMNKMGEGTLGDTRGINLLLAFMAGLAAG